MAKSDEDEGSSRGERSAQQDDADDSASAG
jgi:hypothetical protein